MIDLKALAAPFPPERISWRVGSTTADKKRGMALAYIDARDVMDRLDIVCGPENWQSRYPHSEGKTVICEVGIRIGDDWIWKSDGAGETDFEAEKGALSDAFKRAAVRWGVGRYLYGVDAPWVDIVAAGKSYRIADHEMPKLRALLSKGGDAPSNPSLTTHRNTSADTPKPAYNEAPVDKTAGAKSELRDRYDTIMKAIKDAKSEKLVNDILRVNEKYIEQIREKSAKHGEFIDLAAVERKGYLAQGAMV